MREGEVEKMGVDWGLEVMVGLDDSGEIDDEMLVGGVADLVCGDAVAACDDAGEEHGMLAHSVGPLDGFEYSPIGGVAKEDSSEGGN